MRRYLWESLKYLCPLLMNPEMDVKLYLEAGDD